MRANMLRLIRIGVGLVLLILGIAGLVLPLLQGWLFLAAGSLLLAPDVPLCARVLCAVQSRFPRLRGRLERFFARCFGDGEGPPPCPPER
jgi:hypothetical protein